jgi:hypothetical protein
VLVFALSCFVIEFFLMFVKHHFLSMMTYMAVTSIFFLNYFDKTFIRLTLYMLFGSVLFDLLWIILQADVIVSILSTIGMSVDQLTIPVQVVALCDSSIL